MSSCSRWLRIVLAFALTSSSVAVLAAPPDARVRKKLIATGWDSPNSRQLVANLAEMEKRPFDGVVFSIAGRNAKGEPCDFSPAFSNQPWRREWFQPAVDRLRGCKFTRLTDNFIIIGANPGDVDWFDDEGWRQTVAHWRIAAWAAKQSGCKGLCFDPEPYTPPHRAFSYAAQPQRTRHSFQAYVAKARQRGREIVRAVAAEYPDITLLCYFMNSWNALSAALQADPRAALAGQDYGLYPAMLDGWLDAAPPTVVLVDGCECAYTYNSRYPFMETAAQIKGVCQELQAPENRAKYRAQVQVGFGLYMDAYTNPKDSPYYIDGQGGPRVERLRLNTAAALEAADEYVWVYGEKYRWWPVPAGGAAQKSWPEALPGCEEALRFARDPFAEVVKMKQAGRLVNLARNGDFGVSSAKSIDGAEQKWQEGGPPAGWSTWQQEDLPKGTLTWDREAGATGKGAAKASRVATGCFVQQYKAGPGERYALSAAAKVHGNGSARLLVCWQKADGRWAARDRDQSFLFGPASDSWQQLSGLVTVPAEAQRLVILLFVDHQATAEDAVWFDDVELYKLPATAELLSPLENGPAAKASAAADWVLCCRPDNDLCQVLTAGRAKCLRCATPAEAVQAAPEGAGLLILADGYPEKTTVVEPGLFDEAARKKLRLYVEYPSALPTLAVGPPKEDKLLRGVVISDIFGDVLRPMRIMTVNGCRFVPVACESPFVHHLALAKVAGVDTAVFGLKDTPSEPLLFEHPRANVLVATTKLSQFVTGRYMPEEAWRTVWRTILHRLRPGAAIPALQWTPSVRPSYGRDEALPPDVERQAVRRSADWIIRSRMLRNPQWPKEALDQSLKYNTVRKEPAAGWPQGDGSFGVLEGFSSAIRLDGSQPMRYGVRTDCACEVAMLMALDGAVNARPAHGRIAANLLDYVFVTSGLAGKKGATAADPAYGLLGWALDSPHMYWGDDNSRALLGALAAAAVLKEPRWNDALARCVLGNLRTTGPSGIRQGCIHDEALRKDGWKHYWNGRQTHYSPHFQAWLWACYCWTYDKTHFEPLLQRSQAGARLLMTAYPKWQWCLRSGTLERSRMILPLAWLVRVDDTPEHRRWLRRVAGDLVALQDRSGGIRETIGSGGRGLDANSDYGGGESTLIQTNGDPVCDMLYANNFAVIGLHEAAAATGDPFYAEAEEKLARFLCRIQVRSQAHPQLDGTWYRAFNFRNWQYWAANADWEWGPWCTETGWTQPWIAGTLALRQMKTSLWDLTKGVAIGPSFQKHRAEMLPDDVLGTGGTP